MRRRRNDGPRLDVVDALVVRRTARFAYEPEVDPDVRAAKDQELAEMAAGHGFGSVQEMLAEAHRVYADR